MISEQRDTGGRSYKDQVREFIKDTGAIETIESQNISDGRLAGTR